jgi:phospholipid transport system substrate-binding protein
MRFIASIAAAALAVCLATPAVAAPASEGERAASKYMEDVASKALGIIADTKISKDAKQAKLDKIFIDSVDIAWVGKFVMGRYWRDATDDQKKRYLKEYQAFVVKHYTSRFAEYTSGNFTITGTEDNGDNEYTVSMKLSGGDKNAEPVLVDYRLRKEGSGFKIIDVTVEGVSMITTQRSEFAAVIGRHNIDYLIEQLANKSLPMTEPK